MPENKPPQSAANHTMFDPPFHYMFVPAVLVLLIYSIYNAIMAPGLASAMFIVLIIAVALAGFKARIYALKVQDRLIRLEEQLRLHRLLPEALRPRIDELTEDQFVGLRFASDAELPELVTKTLANNWKRKEIKEAIKHWRPDYFRV